MLDDATVERFREAAELRGIEVEQLIVHLMVIASHHVDELLGMTVEGMQAPSSRQ
ncbi:MAG TPA: hypothetical protein VM938_04695 [Acidimicrobiales bacterium]|nr:hypothetical protein [Acidimicrobiales bacterium]